MDVLEEEESLRTSTPVQSLDVPHLLDPGENLSDSKNDDRETPDFVVRLGTSLARSEAGTQYKLLKREFSLRPQESPKQHQSVNSGATSVRSSGRVSPIRRRSSVISVSADHRRSSVTSISTEQNQRLLHRGLGRLQRRRRRSTVGLLLPPTPLPKEDLTPREPVIYVPTCLLYNEYSIIRIDSTCQNFLLIKYNLRVVRSVTFVCLFFAAHCQIQTNRQKCSHSIRNLDMAKTVHMVRVGFLF